MVGLNDKRSFGRCGGSKYIVNNKDFGFNFKLLNDIVNTSLLYKVIQLRRLGSGVNVYVNV